MTLNWISLPTLIYLWKYKRTKPHLKNTQHITDKYPYPSNNKKILDYYFQVRIYKTHHTPTLKRKIWNRQILITFEVKRRKLLQSVVTSNKMALIKRSILCLDFKLVPNYIPWNSWLLASSEHCLKMKKQHHHRQATHCRSIESRENEKHTSTKKWKKNKTIKYWT